MPRAIGAGIGLAYGGSDWSPGSLTGLLGYWSADQSVLDGVADADPVGSMAGIAPTAVTLTEATNKPILKIGAGPTGRNVLRFTQASSTKLVDSTVIGQLLSGAGVPFSITTVARVTGTGNNSTWGMGHGTGVQKGAFSNRRAMGTPLLNLYHTNDANSTTTVGQSGLMCDNYWHVDTIVFDGTNVSIYVDGALQDIARVWGSAATAMNRFAIGCTIGASTYANFASMDWAATVVNSVALSVAEIRRLHAWLADRYMGVVVAPWIARDEFTTNETNPLASPRAQQPGPGRWTIVDTGNKLAIANQRLAVSGGSGYVPQLYNHLRVGSPGLMLKAGFWLPGPNVAFGMWFGLLANTTNVQGASCISVTNAIRGTQNGVTIYDGRTICPSTDTWVDKRYFEVAVISRGGTGAFCLVRRPGATKWQLNWVDNVASIAACYPRMAFSGKIADIDNVQLALEGIAVPTSVGYAASLAAGGTIDAHVDGLVYATFSAATGVTKELRVRYTDADNCVVVRCDQTNSLLKVVERVAGAETEILSVPQTWTNGSSYTLGVVLDWQSITVLVNASGSASTSCLSTVFMGTVPSTACLVAVSHDMTEVSSWPKYHDAGDGAAPGRGIFACGDSITRGEVDTADSGGTDYSPYPLDQCGWPQRLCALIGAEEAPRRYAVGGHTVAKQLADVSISLNGYMGTPTDVVTLHGANDSGSLPDEATWKANYKALLATWHRKWPDSVIWVMRPWRRGYTSNCDTLSAWIADIVADPAYSPYCRLGADLRLLLPGSDNGTTNTFDGTHPNRAGHMLIAAAQAALMA